MAGDIHFAVKINFKREGRSVKHCAAIVAAAQVALDFAGYLRREAPFQVLANQSNCGLARHAHGGLPWNWAVVT